jgi:hypothetical protein
VFSLAAKRGWPRHVARKLADIKDRTWFAENPSRVTYCRSIIPGEFADAASDWTVAVRRRGGGYDRLTFPALPSDLDSETARDIAHLVNAMFARLAATRQQI